jgi:TRAP-type mannitol/chloroaromatic compound transport system permease small subunit
MLHPLLALSRGIDRLGEWAGRLASVLVLLAVLASAGTATVRYGLNLASNAWIEVQAILFGAVVYLGGARAVEDVDADVLVEPQGARSERARLLIDIFGLVSFLLPVCVVMGWMTWDQFLVSYLSAEVSPNAGGLPIWPTKVCLPIGFALLTLQGVSELIKRVASLRGDYQLDLHYEKPQQ